MGISAGFFLNILDIKTTVKNMNNDIRTAIRSTANAIISKARMLNLLFCQDILQKKLKCWNYGNIFFVYYSLFFFIKGDNVPYANIELFHKSHNPTCIYISIFYLNRNNLFFRYSFIIICSKILEKSFLIKSGLTKVG